MANRFCNRCGSDVEDTGGFCLLGHRLAATIPDEAEHDPAPVVPPPPPPFAAPPFAAPTSEAAPAPEAVPEFVTSVAPTWAALGTAPGAAPLANDPINDFAPPARMDWGPRDGVKRFSLKRLRAEVSV